MPRNDTRIVFYVALSTIPARLPLLHPTITSLARQTFPPRKILLSAPKAFTRFPGTVANLSLVRAQLHSQHDVLALLETLTCEHDEGPGTKLLCALPRALDLAARLPPGAGEPIIVLADDDRVYMPGALQLMALAAVAKGAPPTSALALSYFVYRLTPSNASIGQGADLFAISLAALGTPEGVRAYFHMAMAVDSRFFFHDDVWISLYLNDVRGVSPCGVPQRVHENELSHASLNAFGVTEMQHVVNGHHGALGGGMRQRHNASNVGVQPRSKPPPYPPIGAVKAFAGAALGKRKGAVWDTSLRRLGGNLTRTAMARQMGRGLRPQMLEAARAAGLCALGMCTDTVQGACQPAGFGGLKKY